MRRGRVLVLALAATAGAVACVDLFHSTSFETLCDRDAAACGAASSSPADVGAPDATVASLPADVCAWSATDVDTATTRACAWLGACGGMGLGACAVRAREAFDCRLNPVLRPSAGLLGLWRCLTQVTSCNDVSECLYPGVHPTCEGQQATGKHSRCVGGPASALVVCGPGGESRPVDALEPCSLEGRSCVPSAGSASCAGTQGTACVAAPRCVDGGLVSCDGFLDVGHDCASFGAGACADDGGVPACVPSADAGGCKGPTATTCDDAGVAHSCVAGRDVAYDCKAVGVGCTPDASASDPLLACQDVPGTPGGCFSNDLCDGDKLTSCAQGRTFTIQCSAFGLGACRIAPAPFAPTASCAPPP
jgi:hypothetical protein